MLAFLLPLGMLLHESLFVPSFTVEHYRRVFDEPVYLRVMYRTIRISALVTLISLLLGYPLAAMMARTRGLVLNLLLVAVLLPLWTSVLVRTYAWLVLLQRNGVVNDLLTGLGLVDAPMQLLRTEGAVVLAMSHVLLPFVVLPLYATLRAIPDDYARAARMLGANGYAVFRHVTLPLSMPGITSGCVMVFLLALGFFVTPGADRRPAADDAGHARSAAGHGTAELALRRRPHRCSAAGRARAGDRLPSCHPARPLRGRRRRQAVATDGRTARRQTRLPTVSPSSCSCRRR